MRNSKRIFLTVIICALVMIGCRSNTKEPVVLKDVFESKFMIGAAMNKEQIYGKAPEESALVERHFNTVTPENVLKWEKVHPEPDEYVFDPVDKLMEFAQKNDMFVVGHVLVWNEQTPDWVFTDDKGNPVSREVLLARMKEHIFTVMGRYKGRIGGWDVVNEAVGDDGNMRKSRWLDIIGPDYVDKAFEYAHAADPDAELYYNDYNVWKKKHRDGVVKLVKDLQAKGLRIDGIGMQGHWDFNDPPLSNIEDSITAFGKLGVQVLITEMEVKVLKIAWDDHGADINKKYELQEELNPYVDGLPKEIQEKLAQRYAEFFGLFVKHADMISRVTFWGVQDGNSWCNDWPMKGRTDYPLIFDRQCKPKPAFDAIVKTAEKR